MSQEKTISNHHRHMDFQHLNRQVRDFTLVKHIPRPLPGWIKAIRSGLGMSMQQLGNKLGITRQSVLETEQREMKGTITINALREAARAMDMELVYGFVPKDGSLEGLIIRRSNELAARFVARKPYRSEQEIQEAIRETSLALQQEMPKILWDTDWEVLPTHPAG